MVVNSLFYGTLHYTDVMFVLTVALYMTFLYRHLSGREHVLLTLQLHWLEGRVVLLVDAIFLLCFFIICAMLFVQLELTLMLFLLKILARGQLLGKFLEIRFRKSLPILDVMHLL